MAQYSDFVRDDYGRPIPGATAKLYAINGSTLIDTDVTGIDGQFTLTGPDAKCVLQVSFGGVSERSTVLVGNPPEYVGPPGSSDNTYTTLAALLASDPARRVARLAPLAGDATPPGNFTHNGTAWVRQGADGVASRPVATGAVVEMVQDTLNRTVLTPELFGATGYPTSDEAKAGADSTVAIQKMADAGATLRLPVTGNGRWYKVGTVSWPSHTRCGPIRFFTRDSNRDVQPVLIDGRSTPKSDYVFTDLEIHGNRLGQTELGYNAAGVPGSVSGTDSQRSGVCIQGRVSDVTLTRPKIWYCAVDGIWIYHDGLDNDPAAVRPADVNDLFFRNITITEPDLRWNGRHGGSSESLDGLTIRGGISTLNGYDMPGYPKMPYSDGGNGRTTNFYGGPKYGRAWDCESYLIGTRYKNHVIDGLDGRGNWGGSVLFYHRRHPATAGDYCENLIVRNTKADDNHGASGDGSITVFALNDVTETAYTGTDAFKTIRLLDNRCEDNYLNINCANDIEIRGGWVNVTTAVGYSVVFGACVDVRYCDIASNKPVLGRPNTIARTGTATTSGWTVATETLALRHDLPSGAARYRYTASITPSATGQAKFTATFTPGWKLTPAKPSSINNSTGNLVVSDAFPSGDGQNAIDFYMIANGLNPTAFVLEFDAERIS